MATNFPSSADSFTNPTSGDTLDNPPHDQQHANINDAMEAVQASLLDGAPLHIDAANERVGVGTTSPVDPLHVIGDVTIEVSDGGSAAQPEVTLHRGSTTPADGDYLGQVKFSGENDDGQTVNYAKITGKISDVTDGTEDGLIEIANIKAGSQSIGYRFTSTDLKLLNGRGLEVDGDVGVGTTPSYKLDVDGDINATGDLRIGGTAVGKWQTYSPTLTNWTTLAQNFEYAVVNEIVFVRVYAVVATMGSFPRFSLPPGYANNGSPQFQRVGLLDNGSTWYDGMVLGHSLTEMNLMCISTSGSFAGYFGIDAATPFTWASNDAVDGNFFYRS